MLLKSFTAVLWSWNTDDELELLTRSTQSSCPSWSQINGSFLSLSELNSQCFKNSSYTFSMSSSLLRSLQFYYSGNLTKNLTHELAENGGKFWVLILQVFITTEISFRMHLTTKKFPSTALPKLDLNNNIENIDQNNEYPWEGSFVFSFTFKTIMRQQSQDCQSVACSFLNHNQ